MAIVRWEPFRELSSLRREMDRLFDSFVGRGEGGERESVMLAPNVDVIETNEEITVKADLPGIDEKDLSVTLSENNLIVKGEKRSEKEEKDKHFHRLERRNGFFERVIPIPVSVDPAKITADYQNGVMEIHLPKKPEAKPKVIPIKVSKS